MFTTLSICVACGPGQHTTQGSLLNQRRQCPLETADLDENSWIACEVCPAGTITVDRSNAFATEKVTLCIPWSPSRVDDDANASTHALSAIRGMLGVAMYVVMYSCFMLGSWLKRDLFAFLG